MAEQTEAEVLNAITEQFKSARLVGIARNQGSPSYVLVFESQDEKRATMTFTAALDCQLGMNGLTAQPRLNVVAGKFGA